MRSSIIGVAMLASACIAEGGRIVDATSTLSGDPAITTSTNDESSSSSSSESSGFDHESTSSDDGGESTGVDVDETTGTTTGEPQPQAGVCAPSSGDSECSACSKSSCCAQLEACSADTGCSCFMTCVYQTVDVFGCGIMCGVDLFAPGPAGDLVSCSSGPCAAACT
ncbi:MAG TPA: hypothetical protein VG755_25055 [Nannocystaceae bacterium]|nr:hypothetical protein [Nannocystaceae bacterium]